MIDAGRKCPIGARIRRVPQNSRLMGVADSPLKDRVIFVQGAPRSGTTWLAALLATHPQITGVETESHLFEFGVDRLFDNFEKRDRDLPGLTGYVERDELVDLVRELCDGIFLRMRSHVSGGAEAEFVVEKTPTSYSDRTLDLQRKRECYPDACYIHLVRDGEAVTRSLMRAPFIPDNSYENCNRIWRECVGYTREVLGDHPRYRELTYEDLRRDPGHSMSELYEWLGVDAGEQVAQLARDVSHERFSELGVGYEERSTGGSSLARATRRVRRLVGAALDRAEGRILDQGSAEELAHAIAVFNFVNALRDRDHDRLWSMTTEQLSLTYRGPNGDLVLQGDEARSALTAIAEKMFVDKLVSELWVAARGGPGELWTRSGREIWPVFFSSIKGDAQRVDVAFGLTPEDGRIASMLVFSVGPLAGRPIRLLSPTSPPLD
jgi:hypothetical protein